MDVIDWKNFFDSSMIILMLSGVSYIIAYNIEYAQCSIYGIPTELITINFLNVINTIPWAIFFISVVISLLGALNFTVGIIKQIKGCYILLTSIFFVVLNILFMFYIIQHSTFLKCNGIEYIAGILVIVITIDNFKRTTKYLNLSFLSKDLVKSINILLITLLFIGLVIIFSNIIGSISANNQPLDNSNFRSRVLIKKYDQTYIYYNVKECNYSFLEIYYPDSRIDTIEHSIEIFNKKGS